jgi:hypothetical protein
MQIWTLKGGKVYTVSYLAKTEYYLTYLPAIKGMMDSFEIVPSAIIPQQINQSNAYSLYYDPSSGIMIRYPTNETIVKEAEPNPSRYLHAVSFYPNIGGVFESVSYDIAIDLSTIYKTQLGTDYFMRIYTDSLSQNWTGELYEETTQGEKRVLWREYNPIYFDYKLPLDFITLDLDLQDLNYPDEYSIAFDALHLYTIGEDQWCGLADVTNTYQIPAPEFIISTSPTSVDLRPGEEKMVELKVESTLQNLDATVYLSPGIINNTQVEANPNIERIEFNPSELFIPPNGVATSLLKIKVTDNPTLRPMTIPVDMYITFPNSRIVTFGNTTTEIKSNSLTGNITKEYSGLTVNILRALNPQEQFGAFWEVWGGFISFIGAGFAAGAAAILFDRLKNKGSNTGLGFWTLKRKNKKMR